MISPQTPVRVYSTSLDCLEDEHELVDIKDLDWPCFDVFVWYGAREKDCRKNVPYEQVTKVIDILRRDHPQSGVIGVARLGINRADAEVLARAGVGIH